MAEKVKLSKDGNSIDFIQSDNIPTSLKKFRQSPEIEGFYRFIYENDLQKEAYEILEKIVNQRKQAKKALKQEAAQTKKIEKAEAKEQALAAQQPKKTKQEAPKKTEIVAKKAAPPTKKAVAKPSPKSTKKAPAKAASKKKK